MFKSLNTIRKNWQFPRERIRLKTPNFDPYRVLEVSLLNFLTWGKFSQPKGTMIDLPVLPLFTGVHEEHTTARKAQTDSHSEASKTWIPSLSRIAALSWRVLIHFSNQVLYSIATCNMTAFRIRWYKNHTGQNANCIVCLSKMPKPKILLWPWNMSPAFELISIGLLMHPDALHTPAQFRYLLQHFCSQTFWPTQRCDPRH